MTPRTLFYFPIIHSQSEMGELARSVEQAGRRRLGQGEWRRKVDLTERFWTRIAEIVLEELGLPFRRTRVYQDGLPICDRERQIVADLAGMGSPNHRLLLALADRGATIMGTESAELLVEEYELAKLTLGAGDSGGSAADDPGREEGSAKLAGDRILASRDAFIAGRIGETLREGETGILFLGLLHEAASLLPADIRVLYPLGDIAAFVGRSGGSS